VVSAALASATLPAMDRRRFREIVAEALDEIPEPFSSRLENVQVVVEDDPSPALLRSMGLDPLQDTLFGLYEGVPIDERDAFGAMTLPDKITIFYAPLVDACRTEKKLRREIRKTVIHELGHFFGFDDDDLHDEGY
jgi:predicted Zn-dependent protease with MMP-like domain